jgi:2-keto-4-pentenoate hydratase/2-oxohepta-3-ene-1,7-dioic acid hydratase in catechol pathway
MGDFHPQHRVPELVEFATTIMTVNSGDVIACGTNQEGLGPIQDGVHTTAFARRSRMIASASATIRSTISPAGSTSWISATPWPA